MLEIVRSIVQEVSRCVDLDDALEVIVARVKSALSLDVCSVYLHESQSGDYVLRATDGLYPEAVGRVRLRPDEGLVGLVVERQEPVYVRDATNHPRYRYFPESGEEPYWSFLGVPLIHYRRLLGILVAQHRQDRPFDEEEVAFLVTIAAQLAAAISDVSVVDNVDMMLEGSKHGSTAFIAGSSASRGVAIGTIFVVCRNADLSAVPDNGVADVEAEEARLRAAINEVQDDMRSRAARMAGTLSETERALFDIYVMMLGEASLVEGMASRIRGGQWAPAAVRDTILEHAKAIEATDDAYLRARADDIRELGRRIVEKLGPTSSTKPEYPESTVLVGDDIGIADIADVPASRLAGLVTARGAAFSHTCVLARALGVPAVVGVGPMPLGRLNGKTILVDGYEGRIYIEPSRVVRTEFEHLSRRQATLSAELEALRGEPAITTDGVRISVHVNTGLLSDITPSLESGAEGVGLYRTEFPFLIRSAFPGEHEQVEIYQRVLAAFAPRPVVMRTLDIGGDKQPSYFSIQESNPFLGWRGIRVTLDRPDIFVTQLRAMLRANVGTNNLRIMFPMVSTPREVDEAITLLDRAVSELTVEGHQVARPPVGIMVEVPSALYQVSKLARRVDFMSIGSNDLTQYVLAVDRTNANVGRLFDGVHPAVLAAIRTAQRGAAKVGVPISVCGDIAGDPIGLFLLLGMGIETVSMTAASVPRAKWLVREVSRARATRVFARALRCEEGEAVRDLVSRELRRSGLTALVE